jgi:NAD(P)-dependent dehydrogenase (short-subunit alcohol dehydrogenase family)
MDINGKVAVITGGGSGIGRATARRLAAEGAAIVIADVDAAMSEESVHLIEGKGGRAVFIKTDVNDPDQTKKMCELALSEYGRLDILHNNAGIGVGVPGYPRAPLEQWRRVIDLDLTAVILGCYVAAPLMKRGGAIVNTASMAGLYPHIQDPIYGAAKAGVVNFTYSLANWWSERKIRVNCVCPGITDTPMVRKGLEAAQKAGMQSWMPSRIIQPETIAEAVHTLVADDSIFGRALEVRPSGPRLVDTPGAPKARR